MALISIHLNKSLKFSLLLTLQFDDLLSLALLCLVTLLAELRLQLRRTFIKLSTFIRLTRFYALLLNQLLTRLAESLFTSL